MFWLQGFDPSVLDIILKGVSQGITKNVLGNHILPLWILSADNIKFY